MTRLAWLDARRDADGRLDGLTRLEQARREPDPDRRRAMVEALAAEPHASPTLTAEIALWRGQDAFDRGDASATVRVLEDLETVPEDLAPAIGALDGRARVALGLPVPPGPAADAAARARRVTGIRAACVATIGGFALVAGALGIRGIAESRRAARAWRLRPGGLGPLALGMVGSFGIAAAWDPAVTWRAVPLFPALITLHVLAAAAQPGLAGHARGQAAVGALAALASLAAGWLVLQPIGVLDELGLAG